MPIIDVGLALGNLLILNLWAFPMSIGEGWALAGRKKAKEQPKTESSGSPEVTEAPGQPPETIDDESPAKAGDWTAYLGRLASWVHKIPRFTAGLVGGGCLTAVVVVIGAGAFALYYLLSGQPAKVSQIVPRFAYWLPSHYLA